MFREIKDDNVISAEEMERKYTGLTILYQVVNDGSLVYKGKVLAIADFDDRGKISRLQMEYHKRNIDTSICYSDNSNHTLTAVEWEII